MNTYTYLVTKVRHETSSDGTHEHIEGVCVNGVHYTRRQVVDSINLGNIWKTSTGDYQAIITVTSYCPKTACLASPYIKTNPDSTKLDNLENLPEC